jgi:hypothetical protein
LTRVATRLATHPPELERAARDPDALGAALREQGAPYVWPRLWALSGREQAPRLSERAEAWLSSIRPDGERRCGFAAHGQGTSEVLKGTTGQSGKMADPARLFTILVPGSTGIRGARVTR